ncbi:leucine-rich repeat and coiled-coil domain-containing protein 1-like [Macrobrachium rosenbergii]|uniref:leucine-rich repeat and coiled-coil domain-containing protein 1-like n=1 Tax=Macrobrachium rosenbergii TaxID=79674 RepID=UPI0034D68FCA
MRIQTENLSGENSKLDIAFLESERREKELEDQVKILTKEVARLNERRTVKKEEEPSEAHGGTDAAKLQRIIDRQADQIKHLRKKLLEMEEDRRLCELDFQEWEKTAHTVRKENSELKAALEDLDRKKVLFTIFEERNKALEEQVKELRREMVSNERKKEKEKRSILKETETQRTQMNEAFTAHDVIRNEMESMALQIQKLECENKDYKKDVAYFEEWIVKDYANHCEDLEDCLGKMFEVSDRHQLLLKEKLQLMGNTRDSD